MLVRLRTDDSLSGKGFKVFYKQVSRKLDYVVPSLIFLT